MKNAKKNTPVRGLSPYFVLFVIIGVILLILNFQGSAVHELTTGNLVQNLIENKVTEITIMPKSDESVYYVTGKLEGYKTDESFKAKVSEPEMNNITEYISKNNIKKYDTSSDPGASIITYIIVNVLPLVVMIKIRRPLMM